MRILVIPDVHLKPWIFDKADKIDPSSYDNIVCLGDIADDWGKQNDTTAYEDTYERLLEFYNKHKDALFCWGNHDISYMFYFLETGFSYHMAPTVGKYLTEIENSLKDRVSIIHRIDDTLFSHGGLCWTFVKKLFKKDTDIDTIIRETNLLLTDKQSAEKVWADDSPLWARIQYTVPNILTYGNTEDKIKFFNVVGHTPTEYPILQPDFLSLDTFSTMSTGEPIGDEKLVIVDTKTHKYKYA